MKHMPKWMIVSGYTAGLILMLISTIITAILFESLDTGTWMGKMFSVAGVSVDVGKIVTASAFVTLLKKRQYLSSLLPLVLYILCFTVSMVASQSLDLNKANTIQNLNIISSDEYKMNVDSFESAKIDIETYRNKIDSIRNSKDERIEEAKKTLIQQRDNALKKRWLTTPAGATREGVDVIEAKITNLPAAIRTAIDNEIKELEIKIENANATLSKSKDAISNLKNGSGVKTTEGLIAYAEWMNPENPNEALGKFYLFKNIFCEILGTYLVVFMNPLIARNSIRAEVQSNYSDEVSKKRLSKSVIEQSDASNEQADISDELIDKFIQAKLKYPKTGYKGISKKIGIPEGKCGKIQVHLVEKGILTKSGNTYKVG